MLDQLKSINKSLESFFGISYDSTLEKIQYLPKEKHVLKRVAEKCSSSNELRILVSHILPSVNKELLTILYIKAIHYRCLDIIDYFNETFGKKKMLGASIFEACKRDDYAVVKYALQQNEFKKQEFFFFNMGRDQESKIDIVGADGKTPLYVACENNSENCAILLLNEGAKPFHTDSKGNHPFKLAFAKNNYNIIHHMTESRSFRDEFIKSKAFYDICESRNYFMIRNFANLYNIYSNDKGKYALYIALSSGDIAMLTILVKCGADINQKYEDELPIDIAKRKGYKHIIDFITNCNSSTTFNSIIKYDITMFKEYLKNEKELNKTDNAGNTILHFAIMNKKNDFVKLILNEEINIEALNNKGFTALLIAYKTNNKEIINMLENNGANTNIYSYNKKTPLHYACKNGNLELVNHLISKKNADVNSTTIFGNTPLHYASKNNILEIVKLLVSKGAKINVLDGSGTSPLLYSILKSNVECAQFLIINGADVNKSNHKGDAPLNAAFEEKLNGNLLKLMVNNMSNINAQDKEGLTALDLALKYQEKELAKELILKGIDVNIIDKKGNTALFYAEDYDIVKLLLEHGASVDIINLYSNDPLIHLARQNNEEIMKLLIEHGANTKYRNENGSNALQAYVNSTTMWEDLSFVGYLIQNGSDINNQDNRGENVLSDSVTCVLYKDGKPSVFVFESLLKYNPDVNIRNSQGNTVLHFVSNKEFVELLINHGADIEAVNDFGETPLIKNMSYDKTVLLVEKGANVNYVNPQNGKTALHEAIFCYDIRTTEYLLSKGANVNVFDKSGKSPLDIALDYSKDKYIKLLIDKMNDVNTKNLDGKTYLHRAASSYSANIVKLFLDKGLSPDIKDNEGNIPLSLALKKGLNDPKAAVYLIEKTKDLNAQNNEGLAPIHIATEIGYDDIVPMLIEKGVDLNITSNNGTALRIAISHLPFRVDTWMDYVNGGDGLMGDSMKRHKDNRAYVKIFKMLIDAGADVNIQDKNGDTAINYFCGVVSSEYMCYRANLIENLDEFVVEYLIDHGADIDIANKKGNTPLYSNIIQNNNQNVTYMLLEKCSDIDFENSDGDTALCLALSNSHDIIIKKMFDKTKNINYVDKDGNTYLHLALKEKRDLSIITELIEKNVDINSINNEGDSVLMTALKNKCDNIVIQEIIKRCSNINTLDSKLNSILHIAFKQKYDDQIIQLIIESIEDINTLNIDSESVLHIALKEKYDFQTIKLIIENMEDISTLNANDESVLHIALKEKYDSQTIQFIIDNMQNIDVFNAFNEPFLCIAIKNGYDINTVRLLTTIITDINRKDANGETALHAALKARNIELVKLLIENKCNLNAPNNDGITPFALALNISDDEFMFEIFNGCSIDNTNIILNIRSMMNFAANYYESNTILMNFHILCKYGKTSLIKENIQNIKYCINTPNKKGKTGIYYAVKHNHNEIVKLLLKNGASIAAENNNSIDLIKLAFDIGNKTAIDLFIEYGVDDMEEIHTMILIESVKRKDKEFADKVLEYGIIDINRNDELIHSLFLICF